MKSVLLAVALVASAAPLSHAAPAAKGAAKSESSAAPQPITAPAGAYKLDKSHSTLLFRVSHLGFSNYRMRFTRFDAQLQFDPSNPSASTVTATIDPASLDLPTPPAGFVETLLGATWLDAKRYPEISFRSTGVTVTAPNKARIVGDLTLHGVTKPITLDASFNGGYAGNEMDPNARIGFSAHGTFKRSDYGVAYGIPAPGTTMGVSDAVAVSIEAEFSGPAHPK